MAEANPFSRSPLAADLGAGLGLLVPHAPAAKWIDAVISSPDPGKIILHLATEEAADQILDRMISGHLDPSDLDKASYGLIRQACPYPEWWKSVRLLVLSTGADVCGRTVAAGMDPWSLTAGQWVTGVYAMLAEGIPKDKLFQFDSSLEAVPPGVEDDVWGADDFDAMVQQARMMPGMR